MTRQSVGHDNVRQATPTTRSQKQPRGGKAPLLGTTALHQLRATFAESLPLAQRPLTAFTDESGTTIEENGSKRQVVGAGVFMPTASGLLEGGTRFTVSPEGHGPRMQSTELSLQASGLPSQAEHVMCSQTALQACT